MALRSGPIRAINGGKGLAEHRRIEQIDLRALARRKHRSQQRAFGVENGGAATHLRAVRGPEKRRVLVLHADAPLDLTVAEFAFRLQHDDRDDLSVGDADAVASAFLQLGQALPIDVRDAENLGRLAAGKAELGHAERGGVDTVEPGGEARDRRRARRGRERGLEFDRLGFHFHIPDPPPILDGVADLLDQLVEIRAAGTQIEVLEAQCLAQVGQGDLPRKIGVDLRLLPLAFDLDGPPGRPDARGGQDLQLPAQLHPDDRARLLQARAGQRRLRQLRQSRKLRRIEVEQIFREAAGRQGRFRGTSSDRRGAEQRPQHAGLRHPPGHDARGIGRVLNFRRQSLRRDVEAEEARFVSGLGGDRFERAHRASALEHRRVGGQRRTLRRQQYNNRGNEPADCGKGSPWPAGFK